MRIWNNDVFVIYLLLINVHVVPDIAGCVTPSVERAPTVLMVVTVTCPYNHTDIHV